MSILDKLFSKDKMLDMALGIFPPEKIQEMLSNNIDPVYKMIESKVKEFPLQEDESKIIGIVFLEEESLFVALAGVNEEGHILRVFEQYDAKEYIKKLDVKELIQKFKDGTQPTA